MKNIIMKISKKSKKILVTHDGSFHTDDIFAAATFSIYFENLGETFEIIRTRNPEIIEKGDYIFDVGGIYNAEINRFDHHQAGGAGRRASGAEAGIEYASFGLVWRKFGLEVCGSPKAFEMIDRKLVAPIDAGDNGLDLVLNKYEVSPYLIQYFFSSMNPTWQEESLSNDEMFLKCVAIAKEILSREITQAKDGVLAQDLVVSIYKNAKDKRIIVLDKHYPFEYVLHSFPEPLFVVYPRVGEDSGEIWGVKTVREDIKTFKSRKNLPESWAGLRDKDLQKATGVADAIFCHRGLFMAKAKSKEGAIRLAELALKA